ncbi:MAG TPA: membrane dipeptidase [Steroidobacteraceae bacterium]|jgi:membrane dipeptidase|nr:membrane dipeptidase [Steroidobacteraceae bacterium]
MLGAASAAEPDCHARVEHVLQATPLIDGHNDLAWELRTRLNSDLTAVDLRADTAPLMTDIPRLHAGMVGGQFWSVWIPVDIQGPEAVEVTLQQIDLVKRMTARWPTDLGESRPATAIQPPGIATGVRSAEALIAQ